MFKRQKSKILVFLLMLGILYGCKRHLLDPLNPQTQQTNLPAKAQLDKVKGFYENGRYKNQPKPVSSGNERMTAADSARFKDFEPQWDKTQVELLPNNEKMLIVPVVRNLRVQYNPEIGFIRRLCIRVDANDDFLEANIVELVGNLTFVKNNYNDIFANHKNTSISGFSGSVIGYQLDYDKISHTEFDNGTSTNTSGDLTFYDDGVCFSIFSNDGDLIFKVCGGGGGGDGTSGSGSGSGGSGGIGSPSSSPITPYTHVPFTPRAPTGPGYTPNNNPSGTTGNTGTIGGGGGNGQYNPPPVFIPFTPPPPPPMPHPGMIWISDLGWIDPPTTVDNGVSWGDEGVPPPMTEEQYDLMVSLDSLSAGLSKADRAGQMDIRQKITLAITLSKLRKSSPIYEKMYQLLIAEAQLPGNDHRATVFKILPSSHGDNGNFVEQNGLGTMSIKSQFLTSEKIVGEEFLHALQDLVAYKLERLNQSYTPNRVNSEFEVKCIMHMIRALSNPNATPAGSLYEDFEGNLNVILPDKKFDVTMEKWIKTLPSPFPTSFTPIQLIEYFDFMNWFQAKQASTYNFTAPRNNELPKAIFLLFN